MRKATTLLLSSVLSLSLLLSACGGNGAKTTEAPAPETTAAEKVDKTEAEKTEAEKTEAEKTEAEATEAEATEAPTEESQSEVETVTDRPKDQLIFGSGTEITGDWANGAQWSNNATDNMIRGLMNDYATVTTNQVGEVIENPTVVEKIEGVVNEDGTKTFTIKIHDDLVFNDGTPIEAKHFVASLMLFAHPSVKELKSKASVTEYYVGGAAYQKGESEVFTGAHIVDEHTFTLQILADMIPYFYDLTYASVGPVSIDMWLGDGYDLKDDGEGCYWVGDMSVEAIKDKIETARFLSEGRVTAGPYNLISYDKGAKQAVLEINDKYKGNFEGQKPSIKKLIIVKAEDATQFDALKTGEIDLLSELTGGESVNKALDMAKEGGFDTIDYDRAGYGKLMFQCDFGPTQFIEVRHAIAYLLDRQEFATTFTGGFGSVVDGPYGIAQWMYQEAEEELDERLNTYSFSVEKANEVLDEGGWTLNEEGGEYVPGEGNIRYKEVTDEEAGDYEYVKEVDGKKLMALEIEWSSTDGNPVSELLKTMLAEGTAKEAGMKINQAVMDFTELLNWMYRQSSVDAKYGVPKYGMYNLATNFLPVYDMSYSFTVDPDLVAEGWNVNYILDEQLDKLSMDMVYGVEPGDNEAYLKIWTDFIVRWNELLPEVPLYSNIYYTIFRDDLKNYEANPFFSFEQAILYAEIEQ